MSVGGSLTVHERGHADAAEAERVREALWRSYANLIAERLEAAALVALGRLGEVRAPFHSPTSWDIQPPEGLEDIEKSRARKETRLAMTKVLVLNMIPNHWSDEQNQDCEPCISANPANPDEIIATAFTFDNPAGTAAVSPAMTGAWLPVFYSNDGGPKSAVITIFQRRSGRAWGGSVHGPAARMLAGPFHQLQPVSKTVFLATRILRLNPFGAGFLIQAQARQFSTNPATASTRLAVNGRMQTAASLPSNRTQIVPAFLEILHSNRSLSTVLLSKP